MYTKHKLIHDYWYTKDSTGPRLPPFHFRPGRRRKAKLTPENVREEWPEELNELADEFYRYYRPVSSGQRDKVDSLVETEWRIRGAALDDREAEIAASEEKKNFF